MTFIYELDPYSLELCRICKYFCKYELHASRFSKIIVWQTDRQTDRQTGRHDRNYIPHRFADGRRHRRTDLVLLPNHPINSLYKKHGRRTGKQIENVSISNQHELAMAPHIQSSGAPEIQWKYNSITAVMLLARLTEFCQICRCRSVDNSVH